MERLPHCLRTSILRCGRFLRAFRGAEAGNIAITAALALPLVVGGFALGGEAGYWYLEQRKLQNAADVSAHAGGIALRGGGLTASPPRGATWSS